MAEITINLEDAEHGLEQRVVEEAARQLLSTWTAPGPDGEQSQQRTALARKIEEEVRETIRAEAAAAAPAVAERILDEGVQRTGTYGEPLGEKVPVRALVADEVVRQLARGGRVHGDRGVLEEMLQRSVAKVIREELQAQLDEAKLIVAGAVGAEAVRALSDAVVKAMPGVKV